MSDFSYMVNKEDAPEVGDMVILQHIHWIVIEIIPAWDISVSPHPSDKYVRVRVKRAIES